MPLKIEIQEKYFVLLQKRKFITLEKMIIYFRLFIPHIGNGHYYQVNKSYKS